MRRVVFCGSTSFPRLVFFFAALRVSDSHVYRKIDLTREYISHVLELTEMLLSFRTGSHLVNDAVVCAILESISGLEPSSDTTEPRHLKLVIVTSFSLFTLISLLMPLVLFVMSLVCSSLIYMPLAAEALLRRSTNFVSSSSSPAKPSTSSAKRRLVIVLPPMLTVPS